MFKLYQPGSTGNEYTSSRLLSQHRAWLGDKMFPQGCYHDILSRSMYYFPQHSHVLPFRPSAPGHVHSHFRHDLHDNGRIPDRLAPYLPFDTRLFTNKSILYDALKSKSNEDGNQSTEGKIDTLATTMTSPSAYSNVGTVETLVTSSSALPSEAKKSFTCPQCKYSTDRKNNLKRHVITMHFDCDRKLECCGTVFRSKAKLREHVTLFHKNGYRCLVCARMFCRKALLRRHMAVHSGKKDFHCEFCSYATSHKSNLERHQKVHAKSARFIYSHRKPVTCFDRALCSAKDSLKAERAISTAQKDEFVFHESRQVDDNSKSKFDHEENFSFVPDEELIEVPITGGTDCGGRRDIDSVCDRDADGNKPDDGNMEEVSFEDDFDMGNSEVNTPRLTTINYLFQPFDKSFEHNSDSWKSYDIKNTIDKGDTGDFKVQDDLIDVKQVDDKDKVIKEPLKGNDKENLDENSNGEKSIVEKRIENKENLKCETSDVQTAHELNTPNRKFFPRLCGLPYRCASCGDRFESQDRFNQHLCESDDHGCSDTVEKSVSLVALILKRGKTCSF